MKKIQALLALALVSGSVMAQTKTESGVKFGLRGGVNLASQVLSGSDYNSGFGELEKDNQKMETSFYFGGYADIPVTGVFSLQPGLSLSGKGGKVEYSQSGLGGSGDFMSKNSLMYIELPVNAVLNFSGFYIGAGPYAGYAVGGKTSYETKLNGAIVAGLSEPERDVKFGSGTDNDFKPFDFGANFLAGYRLESGLNFGVNYGLGLANIDPEGNSNAKTSNRALSFLVGFSF